MNVATQLGSEAAGVSELSLGPCSSGLGLRAAVAIVDGAVQAFTWDSPALIEGSESEGSFFSPRSLLGSSCPS